MSTDFDPNLADFDLIWTSLSKVGRLRTHLADFGQIWPNSTIVVRCRPDLGHIRRRIRRAVPALLLRAL